MHQQPPQEAYAAGQREQVEHHLRTVLGLVGVALEPIVVAYVPPEFATAELAVKAIVRFQIIRKSTDSEHYAIQVISGSSETLRCTFYTTPQRVLETAAEAHNALVQTLAEAEAQVLAVIDKHNLH